MPVPATNALFDFTVDQKTVIGYEQDEVENLQKLLSTMSISDLEHLGYALTNLVITGRVQSTDGSLTIVLEAPVPGTIFPQNTLRVGDEVEIVGPNGEPAGKASKSSKGKKNQKTQAIGVVKKIMATVALVYIGPQPAIPSSWSRGCSLKVVANNISYQRMLDALSSLSKWPGERPTMHHVLFGSLEPAFNTSPFLTDSDFIDKSLNEEQKRAVDFSVRAKDVALIHGPPGTGKTHTLIEVIQQLYRQGKTLLVCGPSNISVDNIAVRLGEIGGIPMVRLGHPARVSKQAQKYSAESQVKETADTDYIKECRAQLANITKALRGCKNVPVRQELKRMANVQRAIINKHTNKESKVIFKNTKVVLATLCGSGGPAVAKLKMKFDVVIIDESAQAIEGECWIAGVQAPKLILAGDHHQLPPTMISPKNQSLKKSAASDSVAGNGDLMSTTMFERVRNKLGDRVCHMLTTQYRMHSKIMKVSNENLYDNLLVAHHSVASHLLNDLPGVETSSYTSSPLVFIDMVDSGKYESSERSNRTNSETGQSVKVGKSLVNWSEAKLAVNHAKCLIASGVKGSDIAIITPYNGQVRVLKMMRKAIPGVVIGSVDGFQGSEKEAVILSLVRSNSRKSVGFLDDYRRINVAITRARRHLCVIANSRTISGGGEFLNALVEHLQTDSDIYSL